MRYILHYTQPGDIIYDGFCGTGMTGVAADECRFNTTENLLKFKNHSSNAFGKRHAIISDLSPIASFIAHNLNYESSSESITRFQSVLKDIEDELGKYYLTSHSNGKLGQINYVVWSDVITCDSCNNEETFRPLH